MWPAGARLLSLLRVQAPADEDPVGLFARVDAVGHLAVEVDQVLPRLRAELVEVEVRVALHKWVERPLDLLHAAVEAPDSLMLLQRKAEAVRLAFGDDTEDVRMEEQVRQRSAQPADQAAHDTIVEAGTDDAAAGGRETHQHA